MLSKVLRISHCCPTLMSSYHRTLVDHFFTKPMSHLALIPRLPVMAFLAEGFTKSKYWDKTSTLVHFRSCGTTRFVDNHQPVFDVEYIIANLEQFKKSAEERKLTVSSRLDEIETLFDQSKEAYAKLQKVKADCDEHRTAMSQQRVMFITEEEKNENEGYRAMEVKAEELNLEYTLAIKKFERLNDILVELVLCIPNLVDEKTPRLQSELIREIAPPPEVSVWSYPEYECLFLEPGVSKEFPSGFQKPTQRSAQLEFDLCEQAQAYLVEEGYKEAAHIEDINLIPIHAHWVDRAQFLRARTDVLNINSRLRFHLGNGQGLPLFLGGLRQKLVGNEKSFPLRYFAFLRSNDCLGPKLAQYQRTMVHALVGCRDEQEMNEEFEKLVESMENFYSCEMGIPLFQTQLMNATCLRNYERKRITFVMNSNEKTIAKTIGSICTCGDYVSRRIVSKYLTKDRQPKYVHLVSAFFFDITNFLRLSLPIVETKLKPVADSSVISKELKTGSDPSLTSKDPKTETSPSGTSKQDT